LYHLWIPNSDPKIKEDMLRSLGASFEDLIRDIPEKIRLRRELE